MKLGLVIARRREQLNMSQEELGKKIGVSKATISRWESGDISNMRRDRIYKLANALDISPLILLQDEPDLHITNPDVQLPKLVELESDTKREGRVFLSYAMKNAPADSQSEADVIRLMARLHKAGCDELMCKMTDESLLRLKDFAELLILQQQSQAEPKD